VANVVVSALATWNGKALKKAKQDVDVFNKQLKTLARTFGVTFSAAAIVSFSKKAIKAFTEDEAAAKRLALSRRLHKESRKNKRNTFRFAWPFPNIIKPNWICRVSAAFARSGIKHKRRYWRKFKHSYICYC
jgi:hypothetical protein